MRRENVAPTEVEVPGHGSGTRRKLSHPAFGMIGASRVDSTGTYLHGSDFSHRSFMTIRIQAGHVERDLSHDWYVDGRMLVEIEMSEAQWATMISSPNQGTGVPCTLRYVNGEGEIPGLAVPRGETEEFARELREKAAAAAHRVDETLRRVEALTGGLSKSRREEVFAELHALRRDLASNMPFVVKGFDEHVETRMERAKVEVAAYIHGAVTRAGLEALRGTPVLALTSGEEDDS